MLFGEYGVLCGGTAFAVTVPEVFFEVAFELVPFANSQILSQKNSVENFLPHVEYNLEIGFEISLFSDFFADKKLLLSLDKIAQVEAQSSTQFLPQNEQFFSALFAPFAFELSRLFQQGFSGLRIEVRRAFSPALGLGSSSALIAAVHTACRHLLGLPFDWSKALRSLHLVQGKGSGYDVAVQMAARSFSQQHKASQGIAGQQNQLWKFDPGQPRQEEVSTWAQPQTCPLPWKEMGVLLESGVYSNTALALESSGSGSFESSETLESSKTAKQGSARFAAEHAHIAADFLNLQSSNDLACLMKRSLDVAFLQGIVCQDASPLGRFVSFLKHLGYPFKSMGAGHGDCFWVLAQTSDLKFSNAVHPLTGKKLSDAVAVDFSRGFLNNAIRSTETSPT